MLNKSIVLILSCFVIFGCQDSPEIAIPIPTPIERKGGNGESCLNTNDCQDQFVCWEQKCLTEKQICELKEEICDGKDNNCNNQIDENFEVGIECTIEKGGCSSIGITVCLSETEVICKAPEIEIKTEICNQKDDDCDGIIDNLPIEDKQNCWVNDEFGPEYYGTLLCKFGEIQCTPPISVAEICDDDIDNDLDGLVNENCSCLPNEEQICYSGPPVTKGIGVCIDYGILTCFNGKIIGSCQEQTIFVSKENTMISCHNKKDDDCDGKIDEEDFECSGL